MYGLSDLATDQTLSLTVECHEEEEKTSLLWPILTQFDTKYDAFCMMQEYFSVTDYVKHLVQSGFALGNSLRHSKLTS